MTAETAPLSEPMVERSKRARPFELTRLVRAAGYVAVVLSLATATGSFFVLMGLTWVAPTPSVVLTAMLVNGGLVAFLILIVAW